MALSDHELQHCEKALLQFMERRRPPPQIRDQLEILYRISGHSIEIFEVRPFWRDQTKRVESPVAKATFVRTKHHWKVFWMRQDLKWHRYEPKAEVEALETFLEVVDQDQFGCFFG